MKLGEASTSAELAAEAAIRKVPEWRGKTIDYERISAGITNINWRISVPDVGRRYFMKLPGQNTSIFIDRKLAKEAAIKVADTGFAPRFVFYDDDEDIEVQEYLEGFRSCNVSDLLDPVIRANVVKVYREIHDTQVLSGTKTGFEQMVERLDQTRQYGAALPRDIARLVENCERVKEKIDKRPTRNCACYNDGYVSNYMVDDDKNVRIIDWEYGANNDPYCRADVQALDASLENMVWRVAARYAELGGGRVIVSKSQLYATFDGLFQKHLLMHLAGDADAAPALVREVRQLLPLIVSTDGPSGESA